MLLAGCGSKSAGTHTSSPKLDDAGKAACSYFTLAHAKAEASGGDAGISDLQQGLATAQQSATPHFADDLSSGVTGGTASAKASQLQSVCRRYGS